MLAPGEAAGGGHGLDEGAEDVAEAQGDHLLAGVHRLAPGCRKTLDINISGRHGFYNYLTESLGDGH